MERKVIELDQGWEYMEQGIKKLKWILEGSQECQVNDVEYMRLYTTVYNMCTQKPPHDYSQQLYDKYCEVFEEYITSTVLPSLKEKHGEFMLRELVKRWGNHKIMVRWMSRFFHFLDRYFIVTRSLRPLNEVGLTCFREQVYQKVNDNAADAVITLIDKECEGEQIDRALLKNVFDIFVEMGMGQMDYYEKNFEDDILKDTSAYYSRIASIWSMEDSCPDYMLKAEECLKRERDRVSHYLHMRSEQKLVEKVQHELLVVYATQLLENENSGCRALLRDDKVEDLSRMYRLYHKIPRGLDPVSNVFKQVYLKVNDIAKAVITLIDKEREGEQIDRAFLKNVLDIFVEMGMGQMDYYEKNFEDDMLKDTGAYYSRKASIWIMDGSCPDYMLKAEECLKRERDRVSHYLHISSEQKLVEKVQHELLVVYATQLLENENSGCHALLRDDKVEDLSRMYRLYHKIPRGLDPVSNVFKQHITAEGTALVQQAEDAASSQPANGAGVHEQVLVGKIIELHDKYMAYVNDCFLNHSLFHKALKEAFEVFCNKAVAGSSSAELLATFCDNILKKGGSEKLSDEAIEETLEKVVKLLAYSSDKDLFAEFYRKKLARRLLFDRSANEDHEKSILTKLKQQCGAQFTSKVEGMVTDLTLARENQTNFEEYLCNNTNVNPGIDLTITVLTTGFWPSYKSFDLSLPPEMVKCVEVFKGFYETKTKHRKLTWIYSLGTCNINGHFEPKTIELIVSTYQAAALLLFNNADRLSYSEIMTQLNLTHDDLVRLLYSLSCAKYKILSKEPNTKTISPTDIFQFNSKFTDRMRRIKIPLPPVDERRKVIEDVDKDRQYAIDAAIVRVMKSQKVLGHQQLVMECFEQLGRMFKPDINAIKKRIEDLITRDYLERDKENPNLFRYLA